MKTIEPGTNPPAQRAGSIVTTPVTGAPVPHRSTGRRVVLSVLVLAVLAAAVWFWGKKQHTGEAAGSGGLVGGRLAGAFPVPVVPGIVEKKDVAIYLDGLGTVQAFNSVTVRSRVDGQVMRIAFVEGQDVHTGDVLAQIDPAPYQTQLNQNVAKRAQDEAQLAIARLTLTRDKELLDSKILAQQDYDVQNALVEQLQATVQADQAAIDNAKVQLAYTTIASPLDGRIGIRQVDQGNIVHANDANGLVVITQMHPISVLFTLPEQTLPQIQKHLFAGETLPAFALGRENSTTLGEGNLAVIDNEIDTMTGTIRLKATFPNEDLKLWPGQFVNVRLGLETRKGGTVVPASVVQRGPEGPFAYVIVAEGTNLVAQVRPVKVAQIEQNEALIDEGLTPGERVVVDGQYKLQAGSKVRLPEKGSAKPGGRGPNAEKPPKPEGQTPEANAATL